jgi:hypothetical protein
MIKTIVTPQSTDLVLSIPPSYVGKKVEVILYSMEEINNAEEQNSDKISLRGSLGLTEEQYQDFYSHAKETRNEWKNT